jgi:hypothetical protein
MKHGPHYIVWVISLLLISFSSQAAHYTVYFAGGQSNAQPQWASAIESTLQSRNPNRDVVVVHARHGGNWLIQWWNQYTNTPTENYLSDFFNTSGTGLLQQRLQSITDAGDSYEFGGFFWFQGEGDANHPAARDIYTEAFSTMTDRLQEDLTGQETRQFPVAIALVDASDLTLYYETQSQTYPDPDIVELRQNVTEYANTDPTVIAVDSRGYPRSDLFHLTMDARVAFGTDMATAFSQAFHEPVADESEVPIPISMLILFAFSLTAIGSRSLAKHENR